MEESLYSDSHPAPGKGAVGRPGLTARGLADKLLGSAPPVALRRFKRKCEKSGILSELKKRQHYEKPSAKRKRKAIAARKKMLRKLAEERRAGM